MDVLIVDDEKIIRDAASQLVERAGHYPEAVADSATALQMLRSTPFDLVLLDLNLDGESGLDLLVEIQKKHPNTVVVMFTAQGSVTTAVEAMRRGALDYLEKPFTREQFELALARVLKHRRLTQRIVELEKMISSHQPEVTFESHCPSVRAVYEVLLRAARTPASILLLGESGTGKSMAARAVHQHSDRAERPFVMVNCPGLSRELLESELFGHVRGAFTGAIKDHWGKIKAADGGTLFLDEIGELPLEIQPKLLRLLQDREYERLGENTVRGADVRVIAATNRDLVRAVTEGAFREDLFYRLNVITVELPPLRQRVDDLLHFAEGFLNFFAAPCGRRLRGFSDAARRVLLNYPWPGNLRELRNVIERAVILSSGPLIEVRDLPPGFDGAPDRDVLTDIAPGAPVALGELEAEHIRRVLAAASSLTEAADILGIDQATLYRKRKKLGLD
jgi:NtrC-family two-component system response regulator AlgB